MRRKNATQRKKMRTTVLKKRSVSFERTPVNICVKKNYNTNNIAKPGKNTFYGFLAIIDTKNKVSDFYIFRNSNRKLLM